MSRSPRCVFDTNIVVSALLREDSLPGRAFGQALLHGEVLMSLPVLEEIAEVLGRSKFDRYIAADDREEFLRALVARAILVEPTEEIRTCRDPKDDKFLELAVSGAADYIITGDSDLLELRSFRGVPIVTADAFLRLEL